MVREKKTSAGKELNIEHVTYNEAHYGIRGLRLRTEAEEARIKQDYESAKSYGFDDPALNVLENYDTNACKEEYVSPYRQYKSGVKPSRTLSSGPLVPGTKKKFGRFAEKLKDVLNLSGKNIAAPKSQKEELREEHSLEKIKRHRQAIEDGRLEKVVPTGGNVPERRKGKEIEKEEVRVNKRVIWGPVRVKPGSMAEHYYDEAEARSKHKGRELAPRHVPEAESKTRKCTEHPDATAERPAAKKFGKKVIMKNTGLSANDVSQSPYRRLIPSPIPSGRPQGWEDEILLGALRDAEKSIRVRTPESADDVYVNPRAGWKKAAEQAKHGSCKTLRPPSPLFSPSRSPGLFISSSYSCRAMSYFDSGASVLDDTRRLLTEDLSTGADALVNIASHFREPFQHIPYPNFRRSGPPMPKDDGDDESVESFWCRGEPEDNSSMVVLIMGRDLNVTKNKSIVIECRGCKLRPTISGALCGACQQRAEGLPSPVDLGVIPVDPRPQEQIIRDYEDDINDDDDDKNDAGWTSRVDSLEDIDERDTAVRHDPAPRPVLESKIYQPIPRLESVHRVLYTNGDTVVELKEAEEKATQSDIGRARRFSPENQFDGAQESELQIRTKEHFNGKFKINNERNEAKTGNVCDAKANEGIHPKGEVTVKK
ncbi:hypothetical protein BJ878DRAFT_478582 [Calycina marina]|uniref:Uncharacterized protein n=1 Tax=Calycina marina TaxID=1763456 RepID=A0A9P8CI54_9HELO|nr:hypothetical protein BJ878DRAFT_478582 [Calycina marina]